MQGRSFIDIFGVESGDRIVEKVLDGLGACDGLISSLTPWSVGRNWVWVEMAGAWIQRKRCVGVTYGLTLDKIDKSHGGLAILSPTNVIDINAIDTYFFRGRRPREDETRWLRPSASS